MKRCGKRISRFTGCAAGILAFLLCLTACARVEEEPEPVKATLDLWYYWDAPVVRQTLLAMISKFNNTHSDVEIVATCVPDEDFKKTLALAIADGNMPDLAIVDSSDVQYYNHMKRLTDVSSCMDEQKYLDQAMTSCRQADGSIIGLPMGVNFLAFYYNTDILERNHVKPPTNLREFVDVAHQTTSDTVYGCAFPSLQSEESTFCFLPILWASGGSLDAINTEGAKQSFDFLRQLSRDGSMSHSTINMTISDIMKEFTKGNLAMMFINSGQESKIKQDNPELQFEVAALPMGEHPVTVLGGEVLTVMSSDQQGEAKEFVRFMAEPEQIKGYLDALGYLAPREDLLEWQVGQHPEQRKYLDYLQSAQMREFTPYWPAVSMAVADVINQVILQEDEPDALEKLDEKIRKIREEYDEGK
ncbi:MAG: extracellular solute-binding protein [Lachnospiraceae bacterium]|nr:extracellular solute-binding protein [Lachnospiraceae bacterium]